LTGAQIPFNSAAKLRHLPAIAPKDKRQGQAMPSNRGRKAGRHFLQIPGPSPVPDRILRAMDMPVIDHRGPEFKDLGLRCLGGMKRIFKTKGHVVIYPSSGTGAWEAALSNALSPGDRVVMYETGQFAVLWRAIAERFGLQVDFIASDWRGAVDPKLIEEKLAADKAHEIKAVCIVHNETSTGATSAVAEVRAAIDAARHPALLLVDTISSLGSIDYRHDEWRVDVTVAGSQKGLMLPPGLSFNAISAKALEASKTSKLPRSFFSWAEMIEINASGYFPYTPATNLLYGLTEAIDMLEEEGLDNVFRRHHRLGEAVRRAVSAWGLDILCRDPARRSDVLTGVVMPDGVDADRVRTIILDHFDMSLGTGLGKVKGKVFRIGHLGDTNDLTILGAIAGVEMGLALAGVPHQKGGVDAAMDWLMQDQSAGVKAAA
jgi:alanine-glyoxylate transaminase/serine-glyoxylate transaminase/serine-pyruvate transaminase